LSNLKENSDNIQKFRKELEEALENVAEIDKRVLKKAVNMAVRVAKEETPVGEYPNKVEFTTKDGKRVSFKVTKKVGGNLRRNWFTTKVTETSSGVTGTVYNNVDYAIPVNNGHRVKNSEGRTVGFVKGKFMLQKAVKAAEKAMVEEFKKAVKEVKQKYDL